MKPETIKQFFDAYNLYFKKKADIAKAMSELEEIKYHAGCCLASTVDNDFTNEYLNKVYDEYHLHKFDSNIVQGFCSKISDMFIDEIDSNLKDNLEITDMNIKYCNSAYENFYGPISLCFYDTNSKRRFTLKIPTISNINNITVDLDHWNDFNSGLYVVFASPLNKINISSKKICISFDPKCATEAIKKYLSGEFDDELNSDAIVVKPKALKNFFGSEDENGKWYDYNNMFSSEFDENIIKSCIDDRNQYAKMYNIEI